MSDAKGLIFDINENEIMSHIEDGTLSQFLKSWRNTQLIKLAKEPQEEPSEQLTGLELANIAVALKRLQRYEDLEEKGLLVEISCRCKDCHFAIVDTDKCTIFCKLHKDTMFATQFCSDGQTEAEQALNNSRKETLERYKR